MNQEPFISVVIPVKNEAKILSRCLNSLFALDYPKDRFEVIVSDGMSCDGTKELALKSGALVVANPGEIVSSGRNAGYDVSRGELVAFTDADCVFDYGWLKNSLKYFQDPSIAGVGGLTLSPKESTAFEKAIDGIFTLAESFQATAHLKDKRVFEFVRDIPGCNAIYRKDALEKVMPVDEGLLTAEDVWMNFCIRRAGFKLAFAPDVVLWHYRRNSPKRFMRQIYRFAVGRAQVGKKSAELLNPLHLVLASGLPMILAGFVYALVSGHLAIFLALGLILISGLSILVLIRQKSVAVALNSCLAFLIFIVFWSAGFLRETIFPLQDARGK